MSDLRRDQQNNAEGAALVAEQLVTRIRARPWGLGVVAVHNGDTSIQIDEGADPFTATSLFEVGSLTKTMTGFLLADAVLAGECALTTTVGELLGTDAGPATATTLLQLATHTSGFPPLPGGMEPTNPADPYADLGRDALIESLGSLPTLAPGPVAYSNLGFMLLGVLLERVAGGSYEELLQSRLLGPLRMTSTGTAPPAEGRLPGYKDAVQTCWWSGLPGAGRVASTLEDMARYMRFGLTGDGAPDRLQAALELATSVHAEGPPIIGLGWHHLGGGLWHNGETYGFHTMMVLFRPAASGVFLVGNSNGLSQLDQVAFAVVTDIARGVLTP